MRNRISSLLVLVAALAANACVGGSAEKQEKNKDALKAYILDKAPADVGKQLNINYGDKLTLLGAKVHPTGTVRPGQRVKVTMYWKVEKPLGEQGWRLFTHVLDGAGARILNIDNVGPLRRMQGNDQVLPPSAWEAGKVYIDEQQFTLPKTLKSSKAVVTVGVWKGSKRLPIKSGPKAGDDRGEAAVIPTSPSKQRAKPVTRVPEVRVDKLEKGQSIKIDGKLDEAAWQTAPRLGPFVDVRTGRPDRKFPVSGSVKLAWDSKAMYVGFEVSDPDIVGDFDKNAKDPHLWEKDTVEIMIDPDGDGDNRDYYEIQINPQNLVFDSQFDTYNQPKKLPDGPFGHQEWSSKLKSAVTVNGTIGKSDDKDTGYIVEASLPWSSFSKAKKTPPDVGQTWRMNFYAMQNNSGVAWSAILGQGNFHRASRFGKVLWAEKGWTEPGAAKTPTLAGKDKPGAKSDKLKKAGPGATAAKGTPHVAPKASAGVTTKVSPAAEKKVKELKR